MAKVNLTIKDRAGGKVSFRLTSHPEPASNLPEDMTPAQKMGLACLNTLLWKEPLKAIPEPDKAPPGSRIGFYVGEPEPEAPTPGPRVEEGPEKTLDLREGSGY